MTKKINSKRTRIYIDENKWEEISRRIPYMDLSVFINSCLQNFLDVAIENGVDLGRVYKQATINTLTDVTGDER